MGWTSFFRSLGSVAAAGDRKEKPPSQARPCPGPEPGYVGGLVRRLYENRDLVTSSPYPGRSTTSLFFSGAAVRNRTGLAAVGKMPAAREDAGFQGIQALREKILNADQASPERLEIFLVGTGHQTQGNKRNWKPPAACDAQKEILKRLPKSTKPRKSPSAPRSWPGWWIG